MITVNIIKIVDKIHYRPKLDDLFTIHFRRIY
eukprot:UN22127